MGLDRRGRLPNTRHAEADTAGTLPAGVGIAGAGAAVGNDGAVGDQVMRRGVGDRRRDDVARAHLLSAGREMHQPAVACAPAHPRGAAVLAAFPGGHQQLDGPPDLVAVLLQRDLLLQRDQPLITFLHDGFRQLTVEFGGGGAGALGVLEGERAREPGLPHHVQRGREVLFGLTGEADDQVGGDRGVRHGRPDPVDDAEITLGPVGPPHRRNIRSEPDCSGMCRAGQSSASAPSPR